jgi:hypothetical protein
MPHDDVSDGQLRVVPGQSMGRVEAAVDVQRLVTVTDTWLEGRVTSILGEIITH